MQQFRRLYHEVVLDDRFHDRRCQELYLFCHHGEIHPRFRKGYSGIPSYIRPNGLVNRAAPEMVLTVEELVGVAPVQRLLGGRYFTNDLFPFLRSFDNTFIQMKYNDSVDIVISVLIPLRRHFDY